MISKFIFFSLAYLFGSIPFGLIIGKAVKGIDIRDYGSHNIGTTNVFRVVGKKWGLVVFALDALKGFAAVKLPAILNLGYSSKLTILLGIMAILGHAFPIWLKFKGGKGVATSLGVFLAAAPVPAGIAFGIWILTFLVTHIISISSLVAAVCFPIACFLTIRNPWLVAVSLALGIFIFYTHRANIQRLLRGEEKRLF